VTAVNNCEGFLFWIILKSLRTAGCRTGVAKAPRSPGWGEVRRASVEALWSPPVWVEAGITLPAVPILNKTEEILRRTVGMLAGGDQPVYASANARLTLPGASFGFWALPYRSAAAPSRYSKSWPSRLANVSPKTN
jgi:hypothetical protein